MNLKEVGIDDFNNVRRQDVARSCICQLPSELGTIQLLYKFTRLVSTLAGKNVITGAKVEINLVDFSSIDGSW